MHNSYWIRQGGETIGLARFYTGKTAIKASRPVLFLELLFDIVVVVAIGGISAIFIQLIQNVQGAVDPAFDAVTEDIGYRLAYNILELMTCLFIWRAMMQHLLRYNDSPHLRMSTVATIIPFCVMAASTYLGLEPSKADLANRMNIYGFVATNLIVGLIYLLNALPQKGRVRQYNLLIGVPLFVIGLFVCALGVTFDQLHITPTALSAYWPISIGLWSGLTFVTVFCQVLASTRKFSEETTISLHVLKERYNALFLIFTSEMFLSIIHGWAESENSADLVGFMILGLVFTILIWWMFTDYLDYLDLKRTYWSLINLSLGMIASIIFLILCADALSIWMLGSGKVYAAAQGGADAEALQAAGSTMQTIGGYLFTIAGICGLISSNVVWLSFKRYNERIRYIVPN